MWRNEILVIFHRQTQLHLSQLSLFYFLLRQMSSIDSTRGYLFSSSYLALINFVIFCLFFYVSYDVDNDVGKDKVFQCLLSVVKVIKKKARKVSKKNVASFLFVMKIEWNKMKMKMIRISKFQVSCCYVKKTRKMYKFYNKVERERNLYFA